MSSEAARVRSGFSIRSKLLIMTSLPLVLLLVLSAVLLNARFEDYGTADLMEQNLCMLRAVSNTVTHLQRERGRSSVYLNRRSGRVELDAQRSDTDKAVQAAAGTLQAAPLTAENRDRALAAIAQLPQARAAVDGHCPPTESFQRYTELVARLMETEKVAVENKTTKGLGKRFVNVLLLENAKEYAGQVRATLSGILAADKPIDGEMFLKVTRLKAGVDCNLTSPALSLDDAARSEITTKAKSHAWQEVDRAFMTVLAKTREGRFGLDADRFFNAVTTQVDDIGAIAEHELESVAAKATEIRAGAVRDLLTLGGGLTIAILLAGISSVVVARGIVRPIHRVTEMLENICTGNGDLTKRLDVTYGDEVGRMAGHFNCLLERLQAMIASIARDAVALASSSNQLSATAEQLAGGAEQTVAQSRTVAAAAEQMSTNMSGMAVSTDQMSSNVKTVVSAVEELTASINEVARSTEEAAGVANSAAELVSASNSQIADLGDAADEIGKVIEVIQEIAEQTNLLALNATIEAARAGDAGKGFAVVATEVKELAKQTGSATEDIRRRIEGIQNSTGKTVKSIGEISGVIQRVNELSRTIAAAVDEQSITTKQIAKNVAESSTAAATVARGVAESASASQEISKTIVGVDQAAKQAAQGAAQTQTSSRELSQMAEQFRELVGQFSV